MFHRRTHGRAADLGAPLQASCPHIPPAFPQDPGDSQALYCLRSADLDRAQGLGSKKSRFWFRHYYFLVCGPEQAWPLALLSLVKQI